MEFNLLPPHLVIDICSYLDDKDMFNVLGVFDNWADSIASCSKIMDKFHLYLDKKLIKTWYNKDLPSIPIKHVDITLDRKTHLNYFIQFLKKYKETIESTKLAFFCISTMHAGSLLSILGNLTHLEINGRISYCTRELRIKLPKLKSLAIMMKHKVSYWNDEQPTIECLKHNKSIEKFYLEMTEDHDLTCDELNNFICTLPNLKHFVCKVKEDDPPIDEDFPAKLEILEITYFDDLDEFVHDQKQTLKRLVVFDAPDDAPEEELLDFVLNEMDLIDFIWNGTDVIKNCQLQPKFYINE